MNSRITAILIISMYNASCAFTQVKLSSEDINNAYELIHDMDKSKSDDEKLAIVQKSIALDPDATLINIKGLGRNYQYIPYKIMGDILVKKERYNEALSAYGNILARSVNPDGIVWHDIAYVWERIGDSDKAINYYWKATEGDYKYESGFDGREYLYNAFKRLKKSKMYELIEEEIDKYDDWTSSYHMYLYYYEESSGDTEQTIDNMINQYHYIRKAIEKQKKEKPTEEKSNKILKLNEEEKRIVKVMNKLFRKDGNKH